MKPLTALLMMLFLYAGSSPAAIRHLVLSKEGEIAGAVPLVRIGDSVHVEVIDAGPCKNLTLQYRNAEEVLQPSAPRQGEAWQSAKVASIPNSNSCSMVLPATVGKMLLYALSKESEPESQQIPNATAELTKLRDILKKTNELVDAHNKQITLFTEEIKQFQGVSTPQTVDEIKARQSEIRKLKIVIEDIKKNQVTPQEASIAAAERTLKDLTAALSRYLRIGGFILLKDSKIVNYRIARGGSPNLPVRLERAGEYPEMIQGDDLYAVIVNRRNPDDPERFDLTFNVTPGAAPNLAPVRPSVVTGFDATNPTVEGTYFDIILPFGQRFRGNDILKVTIAAYLKEYEVSNKITTGKDAATAVDKAEVIKQAGVVKLLDAAEYPQIHALYHYNLSTGILATFLRDSTFQKVKTKEAVPPPMGQTTGGTPAEYQVVEDRGQPRAMPALFFTAYLIPFDLNRKWSLRELIPMPTVGFALSSPDQNFFLGGSSEILRNVQLVYGYHHGRVTFRGGIPVDELKTDTAPQTRKAFSGGAFIGASFNMTFLKTLFGK